MDAASFPGRPADEFLLEGANPCGISLCAGFGNMAIVDDVV
jgi:hypothetical protein